MKLIIDLPDKTIAHIRSDYGHKYFGCISDDDKKIITKAIYDGTPLPDNATNGEVIKALFPYMIINECEAFREKEILTSYEWWDTPYKKGEQE